MNNYTACRLYHVHFHAHMNARNDGAWREGCFNELNGTLYALLYLLFTLSYIFLQGVSCNFQDFRDDVTREHRAISTRQLRKYFHFR